jgi:hypothetical protein
MLNQNDFTSFDTSYFSLMGTKGHISCKMEQKQFSVATSNTSGPSAASAMCVGA